MLRLRNILKFFYILIGITGVVCAVFVYHMWLVHSYGMQQKYQKADAIIVLGAAAWGNKPSPIFRERINHAIYLYNEGFSEKIIFTGGPGFPSEPGESVIARRYALQKGVPEDSILIEKWSKNTRQNIFYAKNVAKKYNLQTFILVSDPYHLKRAAEIAEFYGMKVYASATPTSLYKSFQSRIYFLAKEAYYLILYRIEKFLLKLYK